MRFIADFRGNGRRLTMLAAASVLAISVAGSSMFDDSEAVDAAAGNSAFTQALSKD